MRPLYLSIQLAWAFMWRFCIVVCFESSAQYTFINTVGLRIEQTTHNLTGFFIGVLFFTFLPFVVTMYWLLQRGVFYRITARYLDTTTEVGVVTAQHIIKNFLTSLKKRLLQFFTT